MMQATQRMAGMLIALALVLGLAAAASAMEPSEGPKSGTLGSGQSYTWTAPAPGTYAYACSIHPGMEGKVTVTAGDGMGTTQPVEIQDSAFRPAEVTVPKGASVTWTNRDSIQHTVTAADDAMMKEGIEKEGGMEKEGDAMDGTTGTGSNATPAPGALAALAVAGLAALAFRARREG